ncbi:MAG: MerR family transcriptional regulator [Defluviitaleaceae bacterium]|nr:MerR family transcriptional regulator [Defluviitaleaceae bacterium]
MDLIKITDLTAKLGLTSRSLRYYEQVGLIQSIRVPLERYRYYDAANIERLKQIMILRKMLIPVKDIIRIYESDDMSVVVDTFVNRIQAIDDEIYTLAELRQVVNEFLHAMKQKGVTKISALPILYEGMEKQMGQPKQQSQTQSPSSYEELSALSYKLAKPQSVAIIYLPPMRVLTSYTKAAPQVSDAEGFINYVQAKGIPMGAPGSHTQFEYQSQSQSQSHTAAVDVAILRTNDDFINDSPYIHQPFAGGLFAAVNAYLDEDMSEIFQALITGFDENKYYEVDYKHDGSLRHEALLENLISPDDKRDLVMLMIPVKKRLPDVTLFPKPVELPRETISIAEIENQNPVVWEADIPLDKLIPINRPHYKVLETGEAEYVGWISTRVLGTPIEVKLPFRVDVEFSVGNNTAPSQNGSDSGESLRMYHGHHSKDHNYVFGINMGGNADPALSKESLCFHQPVFRDYYNYPSRGKINKGEYNRVTWIVGATHLACIINGEVRYCGTNFPYMSLDLSREDAQPIVFGSDGHTLKYFRSIKVSQLAWRPKNKITEGALAMITKQSNNIIPNIQRVITDEYGENYWFNGCAKYVMESLGEPDYDYVFFAGLTGDVFTQFYPLDQIYRGDGVSGYNLGTAAAPSVEALFNKCGYSATYISGKDLHKNKEMYLQALIGYIDKGIPVIAWGLGEPRLFGVIVGYEEHGQTLLYIMGNNNKPERISLENALYKHDNTTGGWVFVGEKTQTLQLSHIYKQAIQALPALMTAKTDNFCFGAQAFRVWASDIEAGRYDGMKPEEFNGWDMYTAYICALATNGSCCHDFLKRAQELNPDMSYLEDVSKLYKKTGEMWNNQNGEDLEAIGGGFNVTLEALQDKKKRTRIASKLREIASIIDEIVLLLSKEHTAN